MTATTTNYSDKRTEARHRIVGPAAGELRVRTQSHMWRVLAVRDVSPSGISLCPEGELQRGQPVTLVWHNDGIYAEFTGFVAWVRSAETQADLPAECAGHQIAGLQMHGPQQLASLLRR